MSCDNYGEGYYKVSNKTEFNKLIKGIIWEVNDIIQDIYDLIKRNKEDGKTITTARSLSNYRLSYLNLSCNWSSTYSAYSNEEMIDFIIMNRPKKLKGLKSFWDNIELVDILFGQYVTFDNEKQTIEVQVDEGGNHNLDDFQQLRMTIKLCKLLSKVKWKQRGDIDGGYMQTHCEYGGMDIEMTYGKRGEKQVTWFKNRP